MLAHSRQARKTSRDPTASSDWCPASLLLQGRDLKPARFAASPRTTGAAWAVLLSMEAIPAVVGALWLDAATLGALVDHFAWLQLQTFHVLLRGVAFGDSPLRT